MDVIKEEVTSKAEIFTLGLVEYEMLALHSPHVDKLARRGLLWWWVGMWSRAGRRGWCSMPRRGRRWRGCLMKEIVHF